MNPRCTVLTPRGLHRAMLASRCHAWGPCALDRLAAGEVVVHDGWLGPTGLQALRIDVASALRTQPRRPAGVGRGRLDARVRTDETVWISPEQVPETTGWLALRESLDELMAYMRQVAHLPMQSYDLQLACFQTGGFYEPHLDALAHTSKRRLTAIYYPSSWTPARGGALAVHAEGETTRIDPVPDRLVVFLPDRVLHSVEPVLEGPRVALSAFFCA